jgi:hypothetical protein
MMTREVTVGDFNWYLEQTNQALLALNNSYQVVCPVTNISREQASGYAQWLAEQTDCDIKLPSYQEWLAAVVLYGKPEIANVPRVGENKQNRSIECGDVKLINLLGNVKEWSRDTQYGTEQCNSKGYYVLGNDYLSPPSKKPICRVQGNNWIGFRLVWYN